jgi:hypothetical protein
MGQPPVNVSLRAITSLAALPALGQILLRGKSRLS